MEAYGGNSTNPECQCMVRKNNMIHIKHRPSLISKFSAAIYEQHTKIKMFCYSEFSMHLVCLNYFILKIATYGLDFLITT